MAEDYKNIKTEENNTKDTKTTAILAYITLIGWITAIVRNTSEKKNELAVLHIRQSLGLMLSIVIIIVLQIAFLFIPIVGTGLSFILILGYIAILALWVVGLIAAITGKSIPLPFVGKIYDKYLSFIK